MDGKENVKMLIQNLKEFKIKCLNFHNKNKRLTVCLKLKIHNFKILDHIYKMYNHKQEKYKIFNLLVIN
jgi:hypothetical protein